MSTSPTQPDAPPIGLIAGQGRLPILTALGIRAAGRKVACVGLRDQFDAELPAMCDHFAAAGIIQLGRWIRKLRRWGVREAVMVGRVRKARMYQPLRLIRQLPDLRAARVWFRATKHDKRNAAILKAVADELQQAGITLMDSTQYIPEQLADAGVLTANKPSAAQERDIAFALPIVRRMGDLDIGQSLAVKDREVIAVEAIEGTDAMIKRAGELCRNGKWTLVKVAAESQDMRFDVPTVGLQTIEQMKANGGTCLAVQAGKVILLEKPQFLAAADKAGIAVVGIRMEKDATLDHSAD